MFKKILKSRLLRLLISAVLIYLAFRKVDLISLLKQLAGVKLWFLVINIAITLSSCFLVSFRWSLLLIEKPKIKDIVVFFKSSMSASFYGLFFPTSIAADALKWIIIDEKYPKISKAKLLGSIFLDRFIGMTVFVVLGFVMIFLADYKGVEIPILIKIAFFGLFFGCLIFYFIIFFFDNRKLFNNKWLKRFENVSELICHENIIQIIKGIGISFISDFFWILQMWFITWYFGANLSIMSIFIFIPVISTILILPISIAGFGAREQLFMYFFVSQTTSAESVLLTASFSGIIGIINALFGGLITLTPDFKKSVGKIAH